MMPQKRYEVILRTYRLSIYRSRQKITSTERHILTAWYFDHMWRRVKMSRPYH